MAKYSRRAKKKGSLKYGYLALVGFLVAIFIVSSLFVEDLDDTEDAEGGSSRTSAGAAAGGGAAAAQAPLVLSEVTSPRAAPLPPTPLPTAGQPSALSSPSVTPKPAAAQGSRSGSRGPLQEPSYAPYPFRIFIYDQVVPSLNAKLQEKEMCWAPYSASEVVLPDLIARSSVYTRHAELADFYVVPVLSECYMLNKLSKGVDYSRARASLNKHFQATLDLIQSEYPYWSRTEGRDHVFIFPSERGPSELDPASLQRIQKAIFIVGTVTHNTPHFNSHKDIVVPPARGPWTPPADAIPQHFREGDPLAAPRDTLLHFRGVLPGHQDLHPWGTRSTLQGHLQGKEAVQFLEASPGCDRNCTRAEMLRSQFCLVPNGGVEGWSLRLYDAIAVGCIPVIVADDIELPYSAAVDYTKFSMKVVEKKAEEVAAMVQHVGNTRLDAKQAALAAAAKHFQWHHHWVPGDAFDLLLQELHMKMRFFRNSPYRFWRTPQPTG